MSTDSDGSATAGLVLAAGGGSRMGMPKALVRDQAGTAWVVGTATTLLAAGCAPVLVVVGAAADEVRTALADEQVETVHATDWATGMAATLRAGLVELSRMSQVTAAVVAMVDTPGLNREVVRRLLWQAGMSGPTALVRATYEGEPGHPVVIGAEHFDAVIATAHGDSGARDYLRRSPAVVEVECADLASGADVDTPGDLPRGHRLG